MNSKTEKFIEEFYPSILSTISAISITLLFKILKINLIPKELYSSTITLSGVLIGFLMTSRTLTIGQSENYLIKQLKISNTYPRLIEFFMISIRWCFMLLIASIIGLIVDNSQKDIYYIFIGIWFFLVGQSLLTLYRINSFITKIITGKKINHN